MAEKGFIAIWHDNDTALIDRLRSEAKSRWPNLQANFLNVRFYEKPTSVGVPLQQVKATIIATRKEKIAADHREAGIPFIDLTSWIPEGERIADMRVIVYAPPTNNLLSDRLRTIARQQMPGNSIRVRDPKAYEGPDMDGVEAVVVTLDHPNIIQDYARRDIRIFPVEADTGRLMDGVDIDGGTTEQIDLNVVNAFLGLEVEDMENLFDTQSSILFLRTTADLEANGKNRMPVQAILDRRLRELGVSNPHFASSVPEGSFSFVAPPTETPPESISTPDNGEYPPEESEGQEGPKEAGEDPEEIAHELVGLSISELKTVLPEQSPEILRAYIAAESASPSFRKTAVSIAEQLLKADDSE